MQIINFYPKNRRAFEQRLVFIINLKYILFFAKQFGIYSISLLM